MEIHELNTFSGTLGSGNWLATDNGTDTSKVSAQAIIDAAVGDVNPMLLGNGYGTCSTSSTTAGSTRYVTLSGYELVKGGIIAVRFTYDVPSGSYLNVNSKGAKQIYFHGSTLPSGIISAGDTAFFIYDGTYYRLLGVDKPILPMFGKTLWTGEWTSGAITVPDTSKYAAFIVSINGSPVISYFSDSSRTRLIGNGSIGSASAPAQYVQSFRADISGNTWTLNYCFQLNHTATSPYHSKSSSTMVIGEIIGLIPNGNAF